MNMRNNELNLFNQDHYRFVILYRIKQCSTLILLVFFKAMKRINISDGALAHAYDLNNVFSANRIYIVCEWWTWY